MKPVPRGKIEEGERSVGRRRVSDAEHLDPDSLDRRAGDGVPNGSVDLEPPALRARDIGERRNVAEVIHRADRDVDGLRRRKLADGHSHRRSRRNGARFAETVARRKPRVFVRDRLRGCPENVFDRESFHPVVAHRGPLDVHFARFGPRPDRSDDDFRRGNVVRLGRHAELPRTGHKALSIGHYRSHVKDPDGVRLVEVPARYAHDRLAEGVHVAERLPFRIFRPDDKLDRSADDDGEFGVRRARAEYDGGKIDGEDAANVPSDRRLGGSVRHAAVDVDVAGVFHHVRPLGFVARDAVPQEKIVIETLAVRIEGRYGELERVSYARSENTARRSKAPDDGRSDVPIGVLDITRGKGAEKEEDDGDRREPCIPFPHAGPPGKAWRPSQSKSGGFTCK